jgi:class 3 adenylate cyclase
MIAKTLRGEICFELGAGPSRTRPRPKLRPGRRGGEQKSVAFTGRSAVLLATRSIQRLADILLIAAIIAPLILFGLQFPHSSKLDDFRLIGILHRIGDPVIAQLGSWFRIAWPSPSSKSLFPLGVAFVFWLVKIGVDAILLRSYRLFGRLAPAPGLAGAEGGSMPLGQLDSGAISADSERARAELLRRYREIENALKAAKRKRCSFLSIDVIGSTAMKVGERETDVAATFQAYTELLKKIFEQYGAWKVAWTPDGVMVCFLQLDLAVAAGQRVLRGLERFNETENRLRTPFQVRCGLNSGDVPIFEDSKLESVADRVIDVAGHMQKQAPANTLWLSKEVCNLLANKSGFQPTGQSVDGCEVWGWSLEASLEPADQAGG